MADMFEKLVFKQEDIISFKDGIPGFEKFHSFVVVTLTEHAPFEWLVCTEDTSLRFVIINPLAIDPGYNPDITKTQLEGLGFNSADDVLIYVIVTLRTNLLESTANFVGPLFINKKKMVGRQIVVDSEKYSVQEPVIKNSR
ncbi:MAG: hypothetical protein A2268_11105 [Candidatus Raymondbacteria bacterium RifOxyA12_full_50_37]|uniref:Flagellar assembly factor FliW n=1 Tax=Candidatus Raymondbacteria bacterium RIFOXYD12_FULL_49_13 TaxID=1817890 RepID=A0A1F7F7D2_UNCRA|nr:MAG: hypothetical protein A2268_11105 [Candidatus Raymondbacteria bacterium RifOxyA12_full_50_37]OGJ85559.1 MAG: hypothetical protein A2248_12890 [Candidatus Raymondbacteria bacterium RIFOXYA2_FULL_49_16]OGJ95062.1 MAG: hypothetical protein A2453_07590 [Candidatus Raymondbacteria bacterium RIFOXYC2_FULL_50_21]OGJ95426.1 MAG: hypothetical protein A2350_05630 [Candidatus Raymondbacteria bacterium RifOxyB12_full_50_8]OGK02580.1 MAG: hypothetical protein A2519_12250 [Candidatus Raymondbacteria b